MSMLEKAIKFAVDAHSGMTRKATNTPYILHPLEAAAIVGTMTDDPEIIAAAVLHDVIEDTSIAARDLRAAFGDRVADLVAAETENKRAGVPAAETWRLRKEETIAHLRASQDPAVKMIALGDKLSNMRAIFRDYDAVGDVLWTRFNQSDKWQQGWYYATLVSVLSDLADTAAWKEYCGLVKAVFD